MNHRLLIPVLLFVFSTVVFAQQPPANGESLPTLPSAPYAREDVAALEAHLKDTQAKRDATAKQLAEARTAAAEEGIAPEEKTRRDAEVARLEGAVSALEQRITELEEGLRQARVGPSRARLDARREYDRLGTLAERVAAELTFGEKESGKVEGTHAKAIREAEEELARIAQLSKQSEAADFQNSKLYELLSDLEKLDRDIRWADNRLELAIDEYEHLAKEVFPAYVRYEERAFEGMQAARKARDELLKQFAGTPAAELDLNGKPRSSEKLGEFVSDIDSKLQGARRKVRWLEGRLKEVQQEIDAREDHKDRLEMEAERLKEVVSASNAKPKEAATEEEGATNGEKAEYQKLGDTIDNLEQEVVDAGRQIESLKQERVALNKVVETKRGTETLVEAESRKSEEKLAELLARYTAAEDASKEEKDKVKAASLYKPELKIFTMEEELKAQNERLSAAKRDTRQAQTQVEILDRRVERLTSRIAQIENEELPTLRDEYYRAIGETIGIRAAKVVAVFFAAWLLVLLTRVVGTPLIERIVKRADKKKGFSADEQQRARTLMTVFMTTARVVVYITAIMFAIAQFDVDYGPLLVAAGGVSLAVGFGAQSLVKDFFSGFFILLEGQFSIGDVVEINGKTGTVENLNLRTTVLRSLNGDVHVIPNGEIAVTTNQTKLWSRMVLDIGVAYEENTDEISGIMEAVAKEMRDDEVWGKKVLEYALMGVNELGDSAVVVRILLKTRAGEQWGAGREYRRRLKLKFDELGVEIPWPQRVVSYKAFGKDEAKERDQETRKKKAKILRYVRKSRGEMTEEEAALATMSIEERDRAETLAKREVELAKEKGEEEEKPAEKPAEELKQEAKAADEEMSDAERLAKKMAAEQVEKEKAEAPKDEEKAENKDDKPEDEKKKPE